MDHKFIPKILGIKPIKTAHFCGHDHVFHQKYTISQKKNFLTIAFSFKSEKLVALISNCFILKQRKTVAVPILSFCEIIVIFVF